MLKIGNSSKNERINPCWLLCLILFAISSQAFSQNAESPSYFRGLFDSKKTDRLLKQSMVYSSNGNVYNLMNLRAFLGANNAIISAGLDEEVVDYQKRIIDNLVQSAKVSGSIRDNKSPFKDAYKGWTSNIKDRSFNEESSLYESYAFFYVTEFLYRLKKGGWVELSSENATWWNKNLAFVEQHIWNKWFERGTKNRKHKMQYHNFLRIRTHMGAHWAGTALYLKEITGNASIRNQCEKILHDYDLLLKRNLKNNPAHPDAYIWNSTYDNVEGTDAVASKPNVIQDVSHGNHVISYVVAAHEMGSKNWNTEDIQRFCNTVKHVMYDEKTNTFSDMVDGTRDPSRPGRGNFVADGWVKLANYDTEVKEIFEKFEADARMLTKYNQELQFKSNLHNRIIGN